MPQAAPTFGSSRIYAPLSNRRVLRPGKECASRRKAEAKDRASMSPKDHQLLTTLAAPPADRVVPRPREQAAIRSHSESNHSTVVAGHRLQVLTARGPRPDCVVTRCRENTITRRAHCDSSDPIQMPLQNGWLEALGGVLPPSDATCKEASDRCKICDFVPPLRQARDGPVHDLSWEMNDDSGKELVWQRIKRITIACSSWQSDLHLLCTAFI
mmetsp:Transcript_11646/g.29918  ORF Transcript_11646/g.29918 Transcript_11646/m.29918 type:complete len:213 (+) Transcript_11646:605-1243(+)